MDTGQIQVPGEWKDLLTELGGRKGRALVYVAGASNRGKTTLCRFLFSQLCERNPPSVPDSESAENLLVAVCDRGNFVLTLGITESIRPGDRIRIASPEIDLKKGATLQFGSLYLDRSGKELPRPGAK